MEASLEAFFLGDLTEENLAASTMEGVSSSRQRWMAATGSRRSKFLAKVVYFLVTALAI